jgi:acetyl esterase
MAAEVLARLLPPSLSSRGGVTALAVVAGATLYFTVRVFLPPKGAPGIPDASAVVTLPSPSTLRTLSLYVRSFALRGLGGAINRLLLPSFPPSATAVAPPLAPEDLVCFEGGESPRDNSSAPVPVLVFLPPASPTLASAEGLPVYVNLHGGGFVAGGPGDDGELCRHLADTLQCVVVSADYALAPERPAPAACNDAAAVIVWARGRFRTDKVAVGGFSAGATVALGVLSHPRVRGRVDAVVAFYPPVDLSPTSDNDFEVKNPYEKALYYEAYLRSTPPSRLCHPFVSPSYTEDSAWPRVVAILAGGLDPNSRDVDRVIDRVRTLRGEGARFCRTYPPHCPHGWTHIPPSILRRLGEGSEEGTAEELKWEAYGRAADALREAWGLRA